MLRFGPDTGPVAIVALPLFEEANRTRAFAVALCRALADRGVASVLPDLPGQGESVVPLESLSLLRMQEGYEGVADLIGARGRQAYGIGLRSGALLDALGPLSGRWHLSPQPGPDLLRELTRIKQREAGRPLGDLWYFDPSLPADAPDPPVTIAGNRISTDLLTDLKVKEPFEQPGIPRRVVRLASDPMPADRKVDAAPLWRRAEPDNDPTLAALLADDIAEWIGPRSVRAGPVERPSLRSRTNAEDGRSTGSERTALSFAVAGETLAGTLDAAAGTTGLLIVSGGNEVRIGAHRGMALLARQVAAAGHPVLRFDRRGIGDSTGDNGGFDTSGPDIAAAVAAFRSAQPHLTRIIGFGNCDAASALALFGREAGLDGLVLANPWAVEVADDLPPPAAIRARYAARLKDPRALWRLVRGGVDLRKLVRGLRASRAAPATALAGRLGGAWPHDATVLAASGDNTAIAFRAALPHVPVIARDTDSHSFARPGDAEWLFERIVEKLQTPPRPRGGGGRASG